MSRPVSRNTNEKMDMLNNKLDDFFDDDSLATVVQMKKAQKHISRGLLYGSGARAKLPSVKKKKKVTQSPFTVLAPDEIPERPITVHSSIPPGAHNDQYLRISNLTRLSSRDADRYILNSSSMIEGTNLDYLPGQPPWYVGYQNKVTPSDSSLIYAASRYGFRGSKSIRQYNTKPYQSPERTRTQYTPKFLDCSFRIDEWVPAIRAEKFKSRVGLTSPKSWPENSEYATGISWKRPPTSVHYNRETTIGNEGARDVPPSLAELIDRSIDVERTLHDFAKMESANTFLSPPMTAQLTFDSNWKDRVSQTASKSLRVTMNRSFEPYEKHSLTDASDEIKYSG
jgi:hypothetical protein